MSTALAPLAEPGEIVSDIHDQLCATTLEWLASYRTSADTRAAYRRDLEDFTLWCESMRLDPLDARRSHVNAYAVYLTDTASAATGRTLSASTVARKLSTLSSWYGLLVDDGLVPSNPLERVRRPKLDKDHTTTIALTAEETLAFRDAAATDKFLGNELATVLAAFMIYIGARVSELCTLDLEDLSYDGGHRTVTLHMKGGKVRTRALPPRLCEALDAYLAVRPDSSSAAFIGLDGSRIIRQEVARFVRRAAKAAGIAAADRVTPHSFRHTWCTLARESGATLEERQYALGHADPRTTQRYDRARQSLDRDPSYLVAAALSR